MQEIGSGIGRKIDTECIMNLNKFNWDKFDYIGLVSG